MGVALGDNGALGLGCPRAPLSLKFTTYDFVYTINHFLQFYYT